MAQIRIKNFGPIKGGFKGVDDNGKETEFMDIKKVTVFIGNQGSGKSTVAKLFSTLSWLEKAMVRGVVAADDLNTFKRFQRMLRYQRIDDYLEKESEIEFHGKALTFNFDGNGLRVKWQLQTDYVLPKIMYVPAERNFLAVVDRPDKLKYLPQPLFTFLDEYDGARNLYATGIDIPVLDVRFEYDKQNKLTHIVAKDASYKLRLSEAASGFQSTIPLYLVTKFLAEGLGKEKDAGIKELSLEEQRKQDKIKARIRNDKQLSSVEREARIKLLESEPACFINIVEEPEQNLFPSTQRKILFELLKYADKPDENKLMISTHSPYIINYLTLSVEAHKLKKKITQNELEKQLSDIVPLASTTNPDNLAIYQLNEEIGKIEKLKEYKGLPSDENFLNEGLEESNILFSKLLEIEDKCR